MASAERFGIYPSSLVHAGGTLGLLDVQGHTLNPGSNVAKYMPGGAVDPAAHVLSNADPSITFTSRDLKTIFDDVSLSRGLEITAESTIRFQERDNAGTFLAGATETHEEFTVQAGFLYPTSISASQDDDGAVCELTLFPTWDGTNNPIIHNTGQAISEVTPTFNRVFFLGPVLENSVAIGGVQSIQINPGITYTPKRFNGDPYARLGAITMVEPTISVTIAKIDARGDVNKFLRALTGTLIAYLVRGVAAGTRSTDADSFSVTATAGNEFDGNISVTGEDDASMTVEIRPTGVIAASTGATAP